MNTGERTPRGSEEVREALVAAAARLLGTAPPERISGRRLADEAGVNYGLIHHYFGGKEAALREGFTRLSETYAGGSEDGSWVATDPFSMRHRPDFIRALAFASLSGEIDELHITHPTTDAVLDRARRGRETVDETTIRIDVGIATVFHLSRCLFENIIDPWIGHDDPEMSEAVEERFVLILRALTLGTDPGAAAGGRREPAGGSAGPA
jgi:AcrR family transcriptional regulator|tara:strand:+ start:7092 stop:7718 length:627 start_codon:yes stop_codon:yes gene_type:complete